MDIDQTFNNVVGVKFGKDSDKQLFTKVNQPECKHRGGLIIDDTLNVVICEVCSHELNPVWVLKTIALDERRLQNRLDNLKARASIAAAKNRTKCEHCQKLTTIVK